MRYIIQLFTYLLTYLLTHTHNQSHSKNKSCHSNNDNDAVIFYCSCCGFSFRI